MNGDFLVLSNILTPHELGNYYFGFMLVVSVTVLLSSGINQTLLPVFAKLKHDAAGLQRQFFKLSGAICLLCSLLCLGLIALGPSAVHWIWGGKWDDANIVLITIAAVVPVRLTATLAAVTLEAKGAWGTKSLLLTLESVLMLILSWIGGTYGGLAGACMAVALQRVISGLIAFPIAGRKVGLSYVKIMEFFIRTFSSLVFSVFFLLWMDATRHVGETGIALGMNLLIETTGAIVIFIITSYLVNRDLLLAMVGLIKARI
jgi:O-antigen/teichoic acid export membrane protein